MGCSEARGGLRELRVASRVVSFSGPPFGVDSTIHTVHTYCEGFLYENRLESRKSLRSNVKNFRSPDDFRVFPAIKSLVGLRWTSKKRKNLDTETT